jgi:hypothetical protein
MGILINQTLGDHTGKVGNLCYRRRNGKIVVYRLPDKIKKSESKASIEIRERMKPMSRFASEVCSFPELKSVWQSAKNQKAVSAYHKVEQANKNMFTVEHPTVNNTIVPDHGLPCKFISAEANKDKVSIIVSLDNTIIKNNMPPKGFAAIILLCFYDPVKNEIESFDFCRIRILLTEWELDNPIEILFKFSVDEGKIFSMYKKSILYYTLLAYDAENYFLGFTENNNLEFNNDII